MDAKRMLSNIVDSTFIIASMRLGRSRALNTDTPLRDILVLCAD
jgi:hypothetical protein